MRRDVHGLMVGLAVLVVMQIQGHSALSGWRLPTHFPDIFIVAPGGFLSQAGLTFEQAQILQNVPGVIPDEIMPIAIASPAFGSKMFQLAMAAMNPEATMFFGIDPTRAFKMMELEFRDGDAADAQRMLTGGKDIALTDGRTLRGTLTDDGEAFTVTDVARHVTRAEKSTVAHIPGGGYRTLVARDGRTITGTITPDTEPGGVGYTCRALADNAGITHVAAADVLKLDDWGYAISPGRFLIITNEFKELKKIGVGDNFALKNTKGETVNYSIVGVVWSPGIDVMVSVFDMGRQFDQRTAASVFGTLEDARRDFGVDHLMLFAANLKPGIERKALMKSIKKYVRVEGMKAGDVRQIKEAIETGFYRLLYLASTVAFAAMAVASLGVTNTVMAGIRTRRWQFGVLRSIGVTRGQLLRLILCEAFLLGLISCALGLGAGFVMALDAYQLGLNNTGYNPGMAIPWGIVLIGVGIVMFITLAASAWPAISVARTEPLSLLQAGRAAT